MATVTSNKTFISGERVTPASLNSLGLPTVSVEDNEIITSKIANSAVTAEKIASAAITADKIASAAITGAAGGGKLAASAITGQTTIADPLADTDEFLVHDSSASALRKVAWSSVRPITLATSQASTGGTSIDFDGIPSWVKRITVMFNGVSTNGTSTVIVRVGAGSVQTSGYDSTASATNDYHSNTTGFLAMNTGGNASNLLTGILTITTLGSNIWVAGGTIGSSVYQLVVSSLCGRVTLSGALDRVRITTVGGTNTFDAGTINIMYE